MRTLILICRLVVGPLFIVSGLIKANDTLGFSYKLGEYFAETALNLPGLEPASVFLAALACLAEIVLGFALLFGGRMKMTTAAILGLTLFFGWLTLYTATCDPLATFTSELDGVKVEKNVTCVTDCGCFGDAMKGSIGRSLTPWESFYKDLILFIFILPVFIGFAFGDRPELTWNSSAIDRVILPLGLAFVLLYSWVFTWYFPVLFYAIGVLGYLGIKARLSGPKAEWVTAGFIGLLACGMMYYSYNHLPIRDYRPYATGKNLHEQMIIPDGEKPDVYENILVYRNLDTGEEKEFTQANYPWKEPETWEWVSTESKLVERGYSPPITDLALFDQDGADITESILAEETPVLWFVMYDMAKSSKSNAETIGELIDKANSAGYMVYGLTSSAQADWEAYRHEQGYAFSYLNCDGIVLKTIVRSNPGLVLLKHGTVKGKWALADMPNFEMLQEALE